MSLWRFNKKMAERNHTILTTFVNTKDLAAAFIYHNIT